MLSFKDSNGYERFLGNNPAPIKFAWNVYGDVPQAPMIPRSEWKPTSLKQFISPIKDQDGVGACNAFDTANIVEGCRAIAGLPRVHLWAGEFYGRINGGQDRGSLLEDAIEEAMNNGLMPMPSGVEDYAWRSRPNDWKKQAAPFRILEAYLCPTFDHLASAVQAGFLLSLGVMWGSNDNPDSDGWLPSRLSGQGGGHAICGHSLVERGGKWGLGFVNSWTERWGQQGHAVLPEPRFGGAVGGWWACRAVTDDGSGVPILKG